MLHKLPFRKRHLITLGVLFSLPVSIPVKAEDESTYSLSANVMLTNDYRFRGYSLSNNDIAIQGGLDLATSSGFYAGTWGSSIESYAGAETELDLYAGYGGEAGSVAYDVGVIAYIYPGSTDTTYYEAYGSFSGEAGLLGWTLGAAYSFSQANIGGQDNIYIYGDGAIPLGESGVSLTGHVGREDGAFGDNKWDWATGLSVPVGQFQLDVQYVDTNLIDPMGSAAAAVSLSASF